MKAREQADLVHLFEGMLLDTWALGVPWPFSRRSGLVHGLMIVLERLVIPHGFGLMILKVSETTPRLAVPTVWSGRSCQPGYLSR